MVIANAVSHTAARRNQPVWQERIVCVYLDWKSNCWQLEWLRYSRAVSAMSPPVTTLLLSKPAGMLQVKGNVRDTLKCCCCCCCRRRRRQSSSSTHIIINKPGQFLHSRLRRNWRAKNPEECNRCNHRCTTSKGLQNQG